MITFIRRSDRRVGILLTIVLLQALLIAAFAIRKRAEIAHFVRTRVLNSGEPKPPTIDPVQFPEGRYALELLQISLTPHPSQAEYRDCLSICLARWKNPEGQPEEILVALPAFLDRDWTDFVHLREGTSIHAELEPLAAAEPRWQQMARVQKINRFDLPLFVAPRWTTVPEEMVGWVPNAASLPESGAPDSPSTPLALSGEAIAARLAAARERIERCRESAGASWEEWYSLAREERQKHFALSLSRGGYFWEKGDHYYRPRVESPYTGLVRNLDQALPIRYLAEIDRYCRARGIHLVALPFPTQEEVSFRRALPDAALPHDRLYPERDRVFAHLLELGIDAIDPLDSFLDGEHDTLFHYDFPDNHPANAATVATAGVIAENLRNYGVATDSPGIPTRRVEQALFLSIKASGPAFAFDVVDFDLEDLPEDPRVLLVGDSFALAPKFYGVKDGNLHDHLSARLGYRPGFLCVPGQAEKMLVNFERSPEMMKNVQILVFVCSSTFFTGDIQFDPSKTREDFWYSPLEPRL